MVSEKEFIKEFKRISNNFDQASKKINTGFWPFTNEKYFREMRKANLEMEMLGLKIKVQYGKDRKG